MLKHLTVKRSRPVVGGWHWFSNRELHFRPQKFWPKGTRLDVTWNTRVGSRALVGRRHRRQPLRHRQPASLVRRPRYARDDRHRERPHGCDVSDQWRQGDGPDDGRRAHRDGPRQRRAHELGDERGSGRSADGYDELVYNNVHISDTGEYVHAAPWSVSSQGRENVSHGCINLSADNGEVVHGLQPGRRRDRRDGHSRPPKFGDHGVMDWDTWPQWTPNGPAPPGRRGSTRLLSGRRSGPRSVPQDVPEDPVVAGPIPSSWRDDGPPA